MKQRWFLVLVCVLAVLTSGEVFWAKDSDSEYSTVNIGLEYLPEILDPNKASSVFEETCILHLFEGLVKFVPDEGKTCSKEVEGIVSVRIEPGQAKKWEISEDGLVYTFYLRDDIYWSDGEPVTAEDFVFSWRRLVNPNRECYYGSLLNGIVENASGIQSGDLKSKDLGITAIDDKTVEVRLERKYDSFLELCACAQLVPVRKDVVKKDPDEWASAGSIVSNGVYLLTKQKEGEYLRMRRNKDYYEKEAEGPKTLLWELKEEADEDSEEDVFLADSAVETADEMTGTELPMERTQNFVLNTEKLDDWRIRAAIFLSLDRDYYRVSLLDKKYEFDDGSFLVYLQEKYPEYDLENYFDRCRLANILAEEAVADGFDLPSEIVFRCNGASEENRKIAKGIRLDMMSILGLQVVTKTNETWNNYLNALEEGKFDVALLENRDIPGEETSFLSVFLQKNKRNISGWAYEELAYDDLKADYTDALKKASELLYGEGGFPEITLFRKRMFYSAKDDIRNIGWSEQGYMLFTYVY